MSGGRFKLLRWGPPQDCQVLDELAVTLPLLYSLEEFCLIPGDWRYGRPWDEVVDRSLKALLLNPPASIRRLGLGGGVPGSFYPEVVRRRTTSFGRIVLVCFL